MTRTAVCLTVIGLCVGAAFPSAQRRLGPKERETILDARLDPGFSSTPLTRVILLPFGNELDYPDGTMILSENFIAAMRQKHPELVIVGPEEAKQLIQTEQLSAAYRAFLGNYATTGVATVAFLQSLGKAGKADGILLGRIMGFGVNSQTTVMATPIGSFSWSKNKAMVGMELALLRTKDGRELWWGKHGFQGEKNENVRDLSKVVCDVFANFFGRVPY